MAVRIGRPIASRTGDMAHRADPIRYVGYHTGIEAIGAGIDAGVVVEEMGGVAGLARGWEACALGAGGMAGLAGVVGCGLVVADRAVDVAGVIGGHEECLVWGEGLAAEALCDEGAIASCAQIVTDYA